MPITKTKTVYRGSVYFGYQDIGTQRSTNRYPATILLQKSKTGESNPKWRQQVARQEQAGTPFQASEQTLKITPGKAWRIVDWGSTSPQPPYYKDVYQTIEGELMRPFSAPNHSPMSSNKAKNQALSRLYSALREERSHVQAIVSAGELPESIRGIADIARKLGRAFRSVRVAQLKRVAQYVGFYVLDDWGNPRRTPEFERKLRGLKPSKRKAMDMALADTWLSYSLGMAPLVQDAKSLAETVARWNFEADAERFTWNSRIRGHAHDTRQLAPPSSTLYYREYGIKTYYLRKWWNEVRVIYRAGLLPDFDAPQVGSAHRLYQLLGLYDPENWIPSVYNLLPMSFVVDYFTNVADVCTAFVTDTTRVRWVIETIISDTRISEHGNVPSERVLSSVIGGKPCYITQGGDLGFYETSTRQVLRTPQAGIQPPTLQFQIPVQPVQVSNLIALVTGARPKSTFT